MSFTLKYQSFPPPKGHLKYAEVPWDSEIYGFPFYELRSDCVASEVLDQCLPLWLSSLPEDQTCLIYSRIPPNSTALAEILTRYGFYTVETLFELTLSFAQFTPFIQRENSQLRLSPLKESDVPGVIKIASSAFMTDRFRLDPNLPLHKADERYARWIENAFRDSERVFVYRDMQNAQAIGFLHTREKSASTVNLSLGAIDGSRQTTGIGAMMYQAALKECKELGYRFATALVSVNNLPIINLLTSFGFRFHNAQVTLHWFKPAEKKFKSKKIWKLDKNTQ